MADIVATRECSSVKFQNNFFFYVHRDPFLGVAYKRNDEEGLIPIGCQTSSPRIPSRFPVRGLDQTTLQRSIQNNKPKHNNEDNSLLSMYKGSSNNGGVVE